MREEPAVPDPVELTRRMFEATSTEGTNAWTNCCAAVVLWESAGLGTTFEGVEAVRGFLDVWAARYEEYEIEPREILYLGNGVIFAVSHHTGRPSGSTGDIRLPREVLGHSYVWENGEITHVVSSGDTPEARAAAERLAQSRE